jgi:micrococcal nuclease
MFRYCRSCGLDFDDIPIEAELPESQPPAGWRPPAKPRPFGRYLAIGIGALLGLGVIGNLAGLASETPQASAPGSPFAAGATANPLATATSMASAVFGLAPNGPAIQATVVRVIDGDTIVVAFGGTEYHVRYIGMDTPESVKPGSLVEAMALTSVAANEALVDGKTVVLEKDVSEVDQFDRLLRHVWVQADGKLVLVGLELVRTGFAQVTTYPPDVKYVDLLLAAQASARTAQIGLWSVADAATPKPTPTKVAPVPLVGGSNCHPSYSKCLPIVGDLNCPDVRAMGKAPVTIIGPDEYRLDRDRDGLGCE